MNTIEMIVIAITAILTLPYLCQLIKRAAPIYCAYLLLGVALGEFMKLDTRFIIDELGKVLQTPHRYFLLFCPNLTMVAVAAGILIEHGAEKNTIDLLLATGLLLTIGSAFLFPAPKTAETKKLDYSS